MKQLFVFAVSLASLACLSPDASFSCDSAAQCTRNGLAGTCEPNHSCSFADSSCEGSGRRYDISAGPLASACLAAPPEKVAEISAGHFHTCARFASGRVACWGKNSEAQIGDGKDPSSEPFAAVPSFVVGIPDAGAATLSCGEAQNCIVLNDGRAQCWGANDEGQLGNGALDSPLGAVNVIGITKGTTASSGDAFACAILSSGKIQCWGSNDNGRLGNAKDPADEVRSVVPVDVLGMNDGVSLSQGESHACAVREAGGVVCWGNNDFQQLGLGPVDGGQPAFSDVALPVAGLTSARLVELGEKHSCALTRQNEAWCWGNNGMGQLGDNGASGAMSALPVKVTGLTTPKDISASGDHTCALTENGSVFCWGDNSFGQLGQDPALVTKAASPLLVKGVAGAVSVSVGNEHSCAWLVSGDVVCWGHNDLGELGDNAAEPMSFVPVQVRGLK